MAKIERLEITLIDLKPLDVRQDAIQSFVSQETPILRIFTDDGAVGTGYTYTIGTGGYAVMQMLERYLGPQLIGRDPAMIEEIYRDLYFHTHATTVGAITSLALAAIDTALWDLRCHRAGLPLHIMAGGAQKSVPAYVTEGGWLQLETAVLVENALKAKAQGFSGFKMKVGRKPKEDVARLEAVRAAVGPDFEIMVDANQAFNLDQSIRRARLLEPLDLAWLEEPLPADDLSGHVQLAKSTSLPIAVGESLYSVGQFREYMQAQACSIVQVDAARVGGITPWLKVAHTAEAFNMAVSPHFLMELHIGLSAAVPNGRWIEYIPQLAPVLRTPTRVENGALIPSSEPGLGIDWDWQAIQRMQLMQVYVK
jgi:L-alanine-DL-glutamate epimerase-like enolase superfamily enzyme